MGSEFLASLELIAAAIVGVVTIGVFVLRHYDEARHERRFAERLDRQLDARDQSWFHDGAWQGGEREAQADLEAGRSRSHAGVDELLDALAGLPAADRHARG